MENCGSPLLSSVISKTQNNNILIHSALFNGILMKSQAKSARKIAYHFRPSQNENHLVIQVQCVHIN